jgi:hypothetical protein
MAAHHRDHHEPPSSPSPPSPHRHHVDLQRAGQSKGGFAAGVEPEEDQDDSEVVEKLRVSLRELLQNSSMLAAFMCSLASAVYAQPPTVPLCYNSVKIAACIQWCAMGSFFLCICACIVLASDIDGVPNDSLAEHLRRTFAFHAVPQLTITAGIFLLSIGYGIDLNDRAGCPNGVPLGLVAGPCCPLAVMLFFWLCRRQRMITLKNSCVRGATLGDELRRRGARGVSLFTPWADRLPLPRPSASLRGSAAGRTDPKRAPEPAREKPAYETPRPYRDPHIARRKASMGASASEINAIPAPLAPFYSSSNSNAFPVVGLHPQTSVRRPQAGHACDTLWDLLEGLELSQFYEKTREQGYISACDLLEVSSDELEQLVCSLQLKPPEVRRLRNHTLAKKHAQIDSLLGSIFKPAVAASKIEHTETSGLQSARSSSAKRAAAR